MLKQAWRKLWKRPVTDAGHVYYVKLNTSVGVFYKIGFTTKNSIRERFAFAGLGDEKLIEKELLFAYHDKAYPIEAQLHKHFKEQLAFGKYSKDPHKPLCGRGQGELFYEDVLGLDEAIYQEKVPKRVKVRKYESHWDTIGCFVIAAIFFPPLWLIVLWGSWETITDWFKGGSVVGEKTIYVAKTQRPNLPEHIKKILLELKKLSKEKAVECLFMLPTLATTETTKETLSIPREEIMSLLQEPENLARVPEEHKENPYLRRARLLYRSGYLTEAQYQARVQYYQNTGLPLKTSDVPTAPSQGSKATPI